MPHARRTLAALTCTAVLCAGLGATAAGGAPASRTAQDETFHRLATYPVYLNRPAGAAAADPTVAEISAVSEDGRTFIHTDALAGRIGFVDITDPAKPQGLGTLDLAADLGVGAHAEPTSVAVVGGYVLVVVDTSESFTAPSGLLAVVDLATHALVRTLDLGRPARLHRAHAGQAARRDRHREPARRGARRRPAAKRATCRSCPAASCSWSTCPAPTPRPGPPGRCRSRADGARRARHPAGPGAGVRRDQPDRHHRRGDAPGEQRRRARRHRVRDRRRASFSAGSVAVTGIDTAQDGVIDQTGVHPGDAARARRRSRWLDATHLATANEGDWKGGTRGWTVFDTTGAVVWDAGAELRAARRPHRPAHRGPRRQEGRRDRGPRGRDARRAAVRVRRLRAVELRRRVRRGRRRAPAVRPGARHDQRPGGHPAGAVARPAAGLQRDRRRRRSWSARR